jgi:hypothetical protein
VRLNLSLYAHLFANLAFLSVGYPQIHFLLAMTNLFPLATGHFSFLYA